MYSIIVNPTILGWILQMVSKKNFDNIILNADKNCQNTSTYALKLKHKNKLISLIKRKFLNNKILE